jgi:redox-sensitive bicupin YhaK (pirin superfamily)
MAAPTYVMTWAEQMPFVPGEGGAECEVAAGSLAGVSTPVPPPPDSWAADADNEVGVYYITAPPGSRFVLPAARHGAAINRTGYLVEGPTDGTVTVGGTAIPGGRGELIMRADASCEIINGAPAGGASAHLLVLQGRPINEPVAQRGPFVMNTDAEIRQAFADYQRTQFGGWPWPEDAVVFPREQGRFADLVDVDGKKTRTQPPSTQSSEL